MRRAGASTAMAVLTMEHTVPADVVEELRRMGHQPEVAAADSLDFGGARLIRRLDGAAVACEAGSDHRTDGQAVGS
jgi:gamma-glutamyltranspeptidase/glutathione hydrolase